MWADFEMQGSLDAFDMVESCELNRLCLRRLLAGLWIVLIMKIYQLDGILKCASDTLPSP